ncbi:ABC transporter ATP-binding protein [Patescibacteria group bacterium]|nr:ABC transporter ATP-binding protein [Patescibacteria group bacterium]
MIELKKVSKVYGEGKNVFHALKNVSFKIQKGEFVAIMGPSGSGKSTLMNILGALNQPSSGTYLLNNEDVGKLSDSRLADFRNTEVGFIFQQFNLLKKTSVYDNVSLPGLYGNLSNLKEKILKVIKDVGLTDKVNNKPNELSGGQIQRVAIARALLMDPSIIMADEPTGNLDSKSTKEILDIFLKIHTKGNTIILITHEPYIAKYAQRVIKLKDGEITSDRKNKRRKTK